MALTTAFADALLQHIFQNTAVANVGDVTGLRGSTTAGSYYISLHTSSPGVGGSQTTNEANYTGYVRIAVARSSVTGFDESSDSASNHAAITFGLCTSGTNTITHFGIGSDVSGTGNLFMFGALNSSLAVSNGITPSFAIGALTSAAS